MMADAVFEEGSDDGGVLNKLSLVQIQAVLVRGEYALSLIYIDDGTGIMCQTLVVESHPALQDLDFHHCWRKVSLSSSSHQNGG